MNSPPISKVGKSRLLLAMAVAKATGSKVLGSISVAAADVLYISLEDHERRLQRRISTRLGRNACPETLEYERQWRRLDKGGLEDLELWIARHPTAELIVIDTYKRVKSRKRRNGSAYDDDYEALKGLQDLANRHPGLAIVVNHHENKLGPAGRKLRSDVIVPLKRHMRSILAVIDVFRSRFLPSGTPDNAGVIPFLTSR